MPHGWLRACVGVKSHLSVEEHDPPIVAADHNLGAVTSESGTRDDCLRLRCTRGRRRRGTGERRGRWKGRGEGHIDPEAHLLVGNVPEPQLAVKAARQEVSVVLNKEN